MYQLVASVLALLAILTALADAPLAGTAFALFTFVWVVVARPRTVPTVLPYGAAPWDAVYQTPFER